MSRICGPELPLLVKQQADDGGRGEDTVREDLESTNEGLVPLLLVSFCFCDTSDRSSPNHLSSSHLPGFLASLHTHLLFHE